MTKHMELRNSIIIYSELFFFLSELPVYALFPDFY